MHAHTIHLTSRQHYPGDWIIVSFLVCLIIIAWLKFFYFKRLRQIYLAPLSQRFLNLLTKEGSLFNERISVALSVVYIFTYAFLLSLVMKDFLSGAVSRFADYQLFALCAAALFLFWTIKISTIRFLGTVFHTMTTTYEYLNNILVFSFITGLILLPLLILTLFLNSTILLYTTLIINGLVFVFRVMRGFFIGISLKKFSYLFLFVYLCALEILPLLVILKGIYLFSKGF